MLASLPYPAMFDNENDFNSDAASDATLDDCQQPSYHLGAPLTRMVKFEYLSSPSIQSSDTSDLEDNSTYFVRDEEINDIEEDMSIFDLALNGGDGEGPGGDPLLRTTSPAYVQTVIDHIAENVDGRSSPRLSLHTTPSYPSHPLLVRHLPCTLKSARELSLWRHLNSPSLRRDPWNPAPPALSIVERELASSTADRLAHIVEFGTEAERGDMEAYVVMERLWGLQGNPLKSNGDWVDFVRQMLQSLVFLHEHNIVNVSYSFPEGENMQGIMMDIGLAPPHSLFSRAEFPVKYYILDYAKAMRLRVQTPSHPLRPPQSASLRGRTKNVVLLSASRPRASSILSDSYIGSLVVDTPAMNLTLTLSCGRSLSDPEVFLAPTGSSFDMDTPKQPHFFSRPSSSDAFSDPEAGSDSDEDEDEGVRVANTATRSLLFAADLKNIAEMLQGAMRPLTPISEVLVPVLTAMRRARTLSLSAQDALRMFEVAVRPLDLARVVA